MPNDTRGLWMYQMGQTARAEEEANELANSAREWQAYAARLEKSVEQAYDKIVGSNALIDALKVQLLLNNPENALNDDEFRREIYIHAINSDRVNLRNLPELTEQEVFSLLGNG